jgi:hypothetical protein
VRRDQFDPALIESVTKRIAVVGPIGDYALRTSAGSSWAEAPDADGFERGLREFDLRRRRARPRHLSPYGTAVPRGGPAGFPTLRVGNFK